jgi:hypothetical protein
MIEFGEILTLSIGNVALVFIITQWRRIWRNSALRPFLGPFFVLMCAWIATVVEDVVRETGRFPSLVFGPQTLNLPPASTATNVFHLIEHASYLVAAAWLLVIVLHVYRRRREAAT